VFSMEAWCCDYYKGWVDALLFQRPYEFGV
jgi:hypothetical protein